MKLADWGALGQAGAMLQEQLAELGAEEAATHVAVNPDSGRVRILIATDLGLLDYGFQPTGEDPGAASMLRGQLHRWASVRGLRVQTDAQLEADGSQKRWLWHLVVDEPRIELVADSDGSAERAPAAVLPFARACLALGGQ
ncbi:MAG: hypothetical protein E6J47_06380 [Chloroflexi bacterium]|nr:MAG: hypothetical protein E6J47_06380 [Chloroflexota bacterium]